MPIRTSHTPGPWSLQENVFREPIITNPRGPQIIARVEDNCPAAELAANARLIRSAPELLDTLEMIAVSNTGSAAPLRRVARLA